MSDPPPARAAVRAPRPHCAAVGAPVRRQPRSERDDPLRRPRPDEPDRRDGCVEARAEDPPTARLQAEGGAGRPRARCPRRRTPGSKWPCSKTLATIAGRRGRRPDGCAPACVTSARRCGPRSAMIPPDFVRCSPPIGRVVEDDVHPSYFRDWSTTVPPRPGPDTLDHQRDQAQERRADRRHAVRSTPMEPGQPVLEDDGSVRLQIARSSRAPGPQQSDGAEVRAGRLVEGRAARGGRRPRHASPSS